MAHLVWHEVPFLTSVAWKEELGRTGYLGIVL